MREKESTLPSFHVVNFTTFPLLTHPKIASHNNYSYFAYNVSLSEALCLGSFPQYPINYRFYAVSKGEIVFVTNVSKKFAMCSSKLTFCLRAELRMEFMYQAF